MLCIKHQPLHILNGDQIERWLFEMFHTVVYSPHPPHKQASHTPHIYLFAKPPVVPIGIIADTYQH